MIHGKMIGVRDLVAALKKIATKFPDRVAAALYHEAQIEMTESKRRCPVAPGGGTLRASGMVAPPVRRGRNISVTLSYGGAAKDYAIAVHEHLSEHSPPSWVAAEQSGHGVHWTQPSTGPKFLESVLNESRATMAARVAARVHLERKE